MSTMKAAYCHDCKSVIAAGNLAPTRTVLVKGKQTVVNTMPTHRDGSSVHANIELIEVASRPAPVGKPLTAFLGSLTRECNKKLGQKD